MAFTQLLAKVLAVMKEDAIAASRPPMTPQRGDRQSPGGLAQDSLDAALAAADKMAANLPPMP
eukprot:7414736-Karenia_brevis.AAC.1